jgi:hypothetical protein
LPATIVEQWRETATDANVDAHTRILCVLAVHVIALLVRHHLERQLIVVA